MCINCHSSEMWMLSAWGMLSVSISHVQFVAFLPIKSWHIDMESIIYRMAGNFGGKIFWRIAENMSFGGIYSRSWATFSHMIFIAKWLIKRARHLPGPWASFGLVWQKWWEMQLKTLKIVVTLTLGCFRCVGLYSDQVYVVWITLCWQTSKLFPHLRCTKTLLRNDALVHSFQWWTPCWGLD